MCLDVGQTKAELWKHTSQHRKAALLIKKQHVKATFSYFPMQCFTPKLGFKERNSERKYALTFIREVKSKSFRFHFFSSRNSKEMILLTLVFKQWKWKGNDLRLIFVISSLRYGVKKCKFYFLSHYLTLLTKRKEDVSSDCFYNYSFFCTLP